MKKKKKQKRKVSQNYPGYFERKNIFGDHVIELGEPEEKKKKKRTVWDWIILFIDNGVDRIVMSAALLVLLMGVYMVMDNYYVFHQSNTESLTAFKPEKINKETLKQISDDVVAWLTVDDTTIDYPIMQGENNLEYLNKNPYGEYALSGSIFLDSRNNEDFTDPYNIIYGHHMNGGLMFGALDEFWDEKYFDTHRTGTLIVGDTRYFFKTIAFCFTQADVQEIFGYPEGLDHKAFYEENAAFTHLEDYTDHLVALTTCKDPATTDRTALIIAIYDHEEIEDDEITPLEEGTSIENTDKTAD